MTIGEAAGRVGISADTIRRWIREGKLPEPGRSATGYRIFTETDLERMKVLLDQLHPRNSKAGDPV